jgi:hypothetical protein
MQQRDNWDEFMKFTIFSQFYSYLYFKHVPKYLATGLLKIMLLKMSSEYLQNLLIKIFFRGLFNVYKSAQTVFKTYVLIIVFS